MTAQDEYHNLVVLALKICLELGINLFKLNSGCCVYVNFSSLWNSAYNGKLALVLGLILTFKNLYGETIREQISNKDVEV